MPDPPEVKESFKISHNSVPFDPTFRPVVQTSLGCNINGAALPHCDPGCPTTLEAGVRKRFAMKPPVANTQLLRELQSFVRGWVRKNLPRLEWDSDQSYEAWRERTNYSEGRKRELDHVWEKVQQGNIHLKEYKTVKSFMKLETYGEYKHARAINGRRDESKTIIGPIVKLMEDIVYEHPSFIKHVPVLDRPDYISKLYTPGAKVVVTDYSAFESLFTPQVMAAVEFELYRWMLGRLPNSSDLLKWMRVTWMGKNVCQFKHFTVKLDGTRMSGEMTTSLGNGFSNLMFMLFLCHRKGSRCDGVVEGDDGLFYVSGPVPTTQDFAELGLIIKLQEIAEAEIGSFCGMIFEPKARVVIADAMKHMAKFGWAQGKYSGSSENTRLALIRAKALSLAYQFSGCPILSELAQYGLRHTRGKKCIKRMHKMLNQQRDWYSRQVSTELPRDEKDIPVREIALDTRLLYERVFDVSVSDQLAIESYLRSLSSIQPLDHPTILRNCHHTWIDYFSSYTGRAAKPDYPEIVWSTLPGWKSPFPTKPSVYRG